MERATMRVLVIGASGIVRRRFSHALLDGGHTVRCLARQPSKARISRTLIVRSSKETDLRSLQRALTSIEAVYVTSTRSRSNTRTACNVAEARRSDDVVPPATPQEETHVREGHLCRKRPGARRPKKSRLHKGRLHDERRRGRWLRRYYRDDRWQVRGETCPAEGTRREE